MKDVTFLEGTTGAVVCHITSLSVDLKGEIKNRLSEICNGAAKASGESPLYTYSQTIAEFLERYNAKPNETKMGMIGELLTHVLLIHFHESYGSISPYFNLEEQSIKKGFDLVLRNHETGELWFSEVKSGEVIAMWTVPRRSFCTPVAPIVRASDVPG